jgi:hypothetical protein
MRATPRRLESSLSTTRIRDRRGSGALLALLASLTTVTTGDRGGVSGAAARTDTLPS